MKMIRGGMKLSIGILVALIVAVFLSQTAKGGELQEMRFSCYCPESCPGTITASGQHVREGILASSREHMGDCAMLYLKDGTFLGFYECLDTGGGAGLRNGTAVDVWAPNIKKAQELMELTEGRIYVYWCTQPRG